MPRIKFFLALGLSVSCYGPGFQIPKGPYILFEPSSKFGIPLMPFPNDLATVKDHSSPTGLRLFFPQRVSTSLELRSLEYLRSLDGFSTLAPIFVSFSEPISDVKVSIPPEPNDHIFLVKVGRIEQRRLVDEGEIIPLDTGILFPLKMEPRTIFNWDPYSELDNLIIRKGKPYWEEETRTLILKPALPLDERSRYVVVMTKKLISKISGRPYVAPFGSISAEGQEKDVKKALKILRRFGLKDKVAFAWSFTTGTKRFLKDVIKDLDKLPPPRIVKIDNLGNIDEDGNPWILDAEFLRKAVKKVFDILEPIILGRREGILGGLIEVVPKEVIPSLGALREIFSFEHVDYFVFGYFKSPFFINEKGFFEPSKFAPEQEIPFIISVPKCKRPVPVVLVGHGYSGSRLFTLAIAEFMARYCFAAFGIDAPYHGPEDLIAALYAINIKDRNRFNISLVKTLVCYLDKYYLNLGIDCSVTDSDEEFLRKIREYPLVKALSRGRAIDWDGDRITDSGAFYFTADMPRTAASIMQNVVDLSQAGRLVKNLDGKGLLGGDFDGDGILDISGELFYIGISMGGIVGAVLAGANPDVKRAVINVPGGNLVELAVRTDLEIQPLFNKLFGPALIGVRKGNGSYSLSINGKVNMGRVKEGAKISIENLRTGDVRSVVATKNFVLRLPTDPQDVLRIKIDAGEQIFKVPPHLSGIGISRNSPKFRFYLAISQLTIDPADPSNWAELWNGRVLMQISTCDISVPVASGFALARAAGFVSPEDCAKLPEAMEGLTNFVNIEAIYPEMIKGELSVWYCEKKELGHLIIGLVASEDTGSDGLPDELEENFSSESNPDPSQDNCLEEDNGVMDEGEDRNGNGVLDISHPIMVQNQAGIFLKEGRVVRVYQGFSKLYPVCELESAETFQ